VINQVEKGDFSARLPIFKLPEFSRIGQSLNTMGESLQLSTAENKRLALIAQQTADAIVIHDVNGNFSFWNRAAEKLFEYKPEEVLGKSANILIPNQMIADAADNFQQLINGKSIDNQITKRINKSGKLLDVSISAAPLIDPNTNEVIGDICSIRDITERKKTEEALRNLEENRQLTHLIQKHIEDERRSLARELHDELGQYVTVIKTFAVGIRNQAEQQQLAKIAENSTVIASAANQIYDGMHNIIRQLRPGSLDNLGIVETLKDLVNNYQKQNPEITFKFELNAEIAQVSETISINLYRIVQEGLNNALKYAKASEVVVRVNKVLQVDGEVIVLNIHDNGIGMDVKLVDQTKHFGLLGMRERVQALEGSFNIESNGGTNITINIPNV
jgi:two-component system, NarL family, sensor histidine kinase UhpB